MEKSTKKLTDAQYEALKQFKKNVADISSPHDTDEVLLKWLRMRNYHVRKAEAYYREMQAFKKLHALDTICETYTMPEVAEKYEYTSFLGFAKDGSIVRYNPVGRGDHCGFIMSLSAYQLGTYAAHILESDLQLQRKQNKKTGQNIHEITYIFDLDGLALQDLMHKCVYEMAFDLLHLVQDYYPEVWGNIFFINAPSYFDTLFNMFKPILRMSVLEKLQFLSRDSTAEVLLKYIDEDVLPAFLGGKRVDSTGNPRCTEFLRFGGKIPRKYHLRNQTPLMPTDPGVTELWLGARRVYNHSVVVHKPNSIVRVELRTENGSIHMSIFFRKLSNDSIDIPAVDEHLDEKDEKCRVQKVSPSLRVQTHIAPINDSNIAPWPGIYIFRFNNSHSWFASRRLIFRIRVVDPDSDLIECNR